ncbi:MAG TPA: DUF1611 domain-containing protein [Candidatus Baltobacteraceae bacterium]|nr:DUF1611 domain-containing protein [Candidatus Baltobacteraceae bacterium]
MHKRRYLILAPYAFTEAKTAHGVLRYGSDPTVAVIDPQFAGRRVCDVLAYLESTAPIVPDVSSGMHFGPTALLIGTAPKGGRLPAQWREQILQAIDAKLEIVSGLHDMLCDDAEFAAAARSAGVAIRDVRKPPEVPLFSGDVYGVKPPILLAVGNDCAVGKMTVMLELARAAAASGTRAEFAPTGQTGIMIAGWGIAVDRVIADFTTGAAEQIVLEAARRKPEYILVEGQGSINHPAYAPVTLALMYGAAPDALLLVVDPKRDRIEGYDTPVVGYSELVAAHESIAARVKPAAVAGVAVNTFGLSDDRARSEIARVKTQTGLPADDVVRFGARALWDAIAPALRKSRPLIAQAAV